MKYKSSNTTKSLHMQNHRASYHNIVYWTNPTFKKATTENELSKFKIKKDW